MRSCDISKIGEILFLIADSVCDYCTNSLTEIAFGKALIAENDTIIALI